MRDITSELSDLKNSEVHLGDGKTVEEITEEMLSIIKESGTLKISNNLEFTQNTDGNITIVQNGSTETLKKPSFFASLFGAKSVENQLIEKIQNLNITHSDISNIG